MNRILVLMSTYQGERYLKEQLESILHQSEPADILIRDDGSNDQTRSILNEYAHTYPQIRVIYGDNIGVVNSFFALLKDAKGYDFYAFSDQDDVWMEDKLSCAIAKLKDLDSTKPALYASCSLLVDDQLNGISTTQINRRGLTFYNVLIQNLMPGHAQVFNQAMLDFIQAHPVDTSKVVVHDFWLALLGITFGNVVFDNTYHTYYRQHGNNEIGYGHGAFGWLIERLRRVYHAKAKEITVQNQLFYDTFYEKLTTAQRQELKKLLGSQKNCFLRFRYLMHAKVYRQKKRETFLFYLLYFLGGYKVNKE
ncbi:MAG: glycosyltransferase [Erysipelotrichaceae bacterium]|nr:glycosyltransferase [Erysipelotrichaceae bacterium]